MSEIKSEVEHVIKTGRQIVEMKEVGFPNQLNTQIDAIKHQYNKLGTQVIQVFLFFRFNFSCYVSLIGNVLDTSCSFVVVVDELFM